MLRLSGYIMGKFVIFLKNAVTQMVYKHAISTVVPGAHVRAHIGSKSE